jgi:hypothetical protein
MAWKRTTVGSLATVTRTIRADIERYNGVQTIPSRVTTIVRTSKGKASVQVGSRQVDAKWQL